MPLDVLEHGQAEAEDLVDTPAGASGLARVEHVADAALEQIVLVAEVGIERGPRHVGVSQDLLHDAARGE
jgi:hypothetical protein